MPLPIDPSMTVAGPEWSVGSAGQIQQPDPAAGQSGFGGMLSNAISSLDQSQTQGAGAAQSLVDGTATDPTSVVMAVERAQLSMPLASQIRTKAGEAEAEHLHPP